MDSEQKIPHYPAVAVIPDMVKLGGTIMTTPPTLSGVETPSTATIVCTNAAFTFKLDQALADNGGIYLIIQASEAKHGAMNTGAPKVFFKYFFVNASSGETSVPMQAMVEYAEAAAEPENP